MASSPGPLSVVLPKDLRERLMLEARRRGLPLSTAVRMLVAERMREIEEAAELSDADKWQRAEAWSTWKKLRSGDASEASSAELDRDFAAALARARRKKRG